MKNPYKKIPLIIILVVSITINTFFIIKYSENIKYVTNLWNDLNLSCDFNSKPEVKPNPRNRLNLELASDKPTPIKFEIKNILDMYDFGQVAFSRDFFINQYPNIYRSILSITWLSDGPVSDTEFAEAQIPLRDLYEMPKNTIKDTSFIKFTKIYLCSMIKAQNYPKAAANNKDKLAFIEVYKKINLNLNKDYLNNIYKKSFPDYEGNFGEFLYLLYQETINMDLVIPDVYNLQMRG